MNDKPQERMEPIRALEELARDLEKGETDPLSVSVCNALRDTMGKIEQTIGKADLDYMGDFLSAAGAVIRGKSQRLLPPEECAYDESGDEAEGEMVDATCDSGEEWSNEALLAHLMEYRVFQDAVEELARRDEAWRSVFPRGSAAKVSEEKPVIPAEVGLTHLLSALRDILEDTPPEEFSHIPQDELFLEEGMDGIRAHIKEHKEVVFQDLFPRPVTRSGVITVFLALLELIRLREVVVRQDQHFGEIIIAFVPGK